MKPSRNDPCPCGSGKKYKHCCLRESDAPALEQSKGHEGTAARAIDWLFARHRKAMHAAFDELLDDLLAKEDADKLGQLDDETVTGIRINLTEWLLAEGEVLVKGARRGVSDYLLGPEGPLLEVGQRDWLQQLAQRPLRLYDVTDVVPGVQMTLCDTLDGNAEPVVVHERSGTFTLVPGARVGCRVMRVEEHFELSGAAYPFSMLAAQAVADRLRATAEEFGHLPDLASALGMTIMSAWLQQFVAPAPMPTFMDAHSGEPLLLITDHYRVVDWQGLASALDGCADVQGDRQDGWERLLECEDGQTRSIAAINLGKKEDRIEIFYKTQTSADKGRAWFDGLAGEAVAFLAREVSDPKGLMTHAGKSAAPSAGMPDLDPQALAQVIEGAIRCSYAKWADEPIPVLDHKTPRQAIQTSAGLERVKGLLRSYEAGEKMQASQQGRPEVSYNFLWEAIGVNR
ncbi:MAG: SEC-C metal-binding domain-containing protein [Polaromonas sp.]